jgi:hypothetical protein
MFLWRDNLKHATKHSMPKIISKKEPLAVLQAVARFLASASIDEIGEALEHAVPRRTLLRRIALYSASRFTGSR